MTLRVVAALLTDAAGRVLVGQRPPGARHAGQWEFPGGKLESGESEPEALVRELEEELGVRARIGALVARARHTYGSRGDSDRRDRGPGDSAARRRDAGRGEPTEVEIAFYQVREFQGEVVNGAFAALRWAAPGELPGYDFLAADRDLVARLARGELALEQAGGGFRTRPMAASLLRAGRSRGAASGGDLARGSHSRGIAFVKAEANGNDFLLVAAEAVAPARRAEFARAICDRHRGVGADGVEFWRRVGGELELTLHNADGGEAEISGNGTRCAVALVVDGFAGRWPESWEGRTPKGGAKDSAARAGAGRGSRQRPEIAVRTAAGLRRARVLGRATGGGWRVELSMGAPIFAAAEIPFRPPDGGASRGRRFRAGHPIALSVDGRRMTARVLSMGNPHCCLLVARFPADWEAMGAALERHSAFPRRTNVEFARVTGPRAIEVRLFERGVGVTESSGTGSCAAAVAALLSGRVAAPVRVITAGGEQEVAWNPARREQEVRLRGPARVMATGVWLGSRGGGRAEWSGPARR